MARAVIPHVQLNLFPAGAVAPTPGNMSLTNGRANKLSVSDRAFHDWYRFVLSYPPHLVREYIAKFAVPSGQMVLDPFCGTGTTLIEAKILGINSIGIEANPMAHFASSVKTNWKINPDGLREHAGCVAEQAENSLVKTSVLRTLPYEQHALLLKDSISPRPLHKALVLLETLRNQSGSTYMNHELLAFAKALIASSNLHFGPEVGVTKQKKEDAPLIEYWMQEILNMSEDLRSANVNKAFSKVICADARQMDSILTERSIDAVFTSPPYPNEKDYSRTTRLESVILGFVQDRAGLKTLKKNLLRSNTRNVYKGDDDERWVEHNASVQTLAAQIEQRRIDLGKTSGFERLYGKVTKLYFGGMARHLAELKDFLKPGAYLGYVVGDQASYFQVMIRTGQILAEIAESLGYKVMDIVLFRTRLATATKQQMREEVVVLQWPGKERG